MESPYGSIKEFDNLLMFFVRWTITCDVKSGSTGCVFGELTESAEKLSVDRTYYTYLVAPEVDIRCTLVNPIVLHLEER